ncbi:unnamed protein product, partial [Prorocentrum cordatum]
ESDADAEIFPRKQAACVATHVIVGKPRTGVLSCLWPFLRVADRRVADLHPGRLDRGRGMVAGVVVARRGLHRGGLAGGGAPRQPRRFAGGAGAGHGGLPRVSVPVRRPGGRGPSGVALLWHHRRPAGPEAAGGPQLRPGSAAAGAGCPVRSLCRLLAEPGRPVAEPRREAGAAEEVLPPQGGAHRRGHPRDAPGPRGSWAPPDSLEHYACYWGASLGGALAAACVFAHGTGRPLFGAAPRAAGAACAERKPKQL